MEHFEGNDIIKTIKKNLYSKRIHTLNIFLLNIILKIKN